MPFFSSNELDDFQMNRVPVKNVQDRVRLIAKKIREGKEDPYVRAIAGNVLRKARIKQRDWESEARAMFDYVKQNVRYTLDAYDLDLYQRARRTLQLGIGDCDDQVILLGALLQAIGHDVRIKIVDTKNSPVSGWNHIYLLVGIPPHNPDKWIPIDVATENQQFNWEVPKHLVKRFRVYSF